MIIRSYRRKLGTVRRFRPTGKDLPMSANYKVQAWWTLAGWIEDAFGLEGGTPEAIYEEVTGPRGLTADTTHELLLAARDGGYLTTGREEVE